MLHIPHKADDLRIASRRIVVDAVRENPGVILGDLSAITSLGVGTVSTIVNEMVEAGALTRLEIKSKGRGRPKASLDFESDFRYLMLFRTSAQEVEASLLDYNGNLKDRLYSRRQGTEPFLFGQAIATLGNDIIQRQKIDPATIGIVSVTLKAIHGPHASGANRQALTANNIGDALGIPKRNIVIQHEQAQVAYGLLKKSDNAGSVAVLSLGNAVSLAIATMQDSGEITTHSPNFGHTISHPNGPACVCGKRGCVEASANALGLLRASLGNPDGRAKTDYIPDAQMRRIAELARSGDFKTREGFALGGEAIGLGLGQLFNLSGVMPLWIMGQGTAHLDLMMPTINAGLVSSLGQDIANSININVLESQEQAVFDCNQASALDTLDRVVCQQTFHRKL